MKTRHTPKPWMISGPEDMPGFYCLMNHVDRFEAAYDSNDLTIQEPVFQEEHANALLIELAPEMFDTLENLLEHCVVIPKYRGSGCNKEREADAAIASARAIVKTVRETRYL